MQSQLSEADATEILTTKTPAAAVVTRSAKKQKTDSQKKPAASETEKSGEKEDDPNKEGMKNLYAELLGLDELLRDKLFIIQVRCFLVQKQSR